jgi:hypothetical protein
MFQSRLSDSGLTVTGLARVYCINVVPLPSNIVVEWVALLFRTRKITASNLDTVVCYPMRVNRGFPPVCASNYVTSHFSPILYISLNANELLTVSLNDSLTNKFVISGETNVVTAPQGAADCARQQTLEPPSPGTF